MHTREGMVKRKRRQVRSVRQLPRACSARPNVPCSIRSATTASQPEPACACKATRAQEVAGSLGGVALAAFMCCAFSCYLLRVAEMGRLGSAGVLHLFYPEPSPPSGAKDAATAGDAGPGYKVRPRIARCTVTNADLTINDIWELVCIAKRNHPNCSIV